MSLPPKICMHPFSQMRAGLDQFIPCCAIWLTDEYRNLDHGSDRWNGPAAQKIRRRILNGDYSFCRTEYCGKPQVRTTGAKPEVRESYLPLSDANWQAIQRGEVVMPDGPSYLGLQLDPRCNLTCKSCRTQPIITLREQDVAPVAKMESDLERYAQSIHGLMIGDGEAFFSPWYRKVIKGLSTDKFPHLQFMFVLSNGLLLNQKMYDSLLPGIKFVKVLSISMDAGNEATYAKVRGGNWDTLMNNLKWISQMRLRGDFVFWQINFTVRRENFRSIPEFVKLGQSLGVDSIKFTALFPWGNMAFKYEDEAIHLTSHPDHFRLAQIYSKVAKEPKVRWSLPVPAQMTLGSILLRQAQKFSSQTRSFMESNWLKFRRMVIP